MNHTTTPAGGVMPRQIPFIIGNEACERFSFYGIRNVLTDFLVGYFFISLAEAQRQPAAKEVFHLFVMGVYFFPLLGGWLADRFVGKYRVIFWLSLVYCVGQILLALSIDSKEGFYAGLFLIALGSGGIKPCVSSFVGDQFDQTNKHLAKVVFDAFYFIINFGSFFASLLIPPLLKSGHARLAFGVPAVLMAMSTVVFFVGRKRYVNVPPAGNDANGFLAVCATALARGPMNVGTVLVILGGTLALGALFLIPWLGAVASVCLCIVIVGAFAGSGVWLRLENARGHHPDESIDGVKAVLRVLVIFALVTPFWSLFDQKASTWVLQAKAMTLPGWSWFTTASQMQALNPMLVMLLIPFNNAVLYPVLRRVGVAVTPLRRMGAGIAFSGLSWVVAGTLQVFIDRAVTVPILWQTLPYAFLTLGEVLVSATGLEFAYSQAPGRMKSVLMSFWLLSVTIGNLWVLLVNALIKNEAVTTFITDLGWGVMTTQMYFFALFAFAAAIAFALYARQYTVVDHYRKQTTT